MRSHHPTSSRRALVTGVAGFIGSALTRQLLAAGWEVVGIDDFSGGWAERLPANPRFEFHQGDVGEPGFLTGLLSGEYPFDHLVHLAACVGVRAVLADPERCRVRNLAGVREILSAVEALPRGARPRVFNASSSEVYAPSSEALGEDDPLRPTAGVGRWAYAASKRLGEERLDAAASLWPGGEAPVHLRFFNVVGPGQDGDSGMVLPTFVERALLGEAIPVHGDGGQVRTFAHVDEIAAVLQELLDHPRLPAGALNVGGRARTTILELARMVKRLAGSESSLQSTDPMTSLGAAFEAVEFREPKLDRLRQLGITIPDRTLEEIVRDSLAYHSEMARPSALREAGGTLWCGSPAS
jgi:UDP-glucose 4-epimerase